jgi:hypothetical protein
MQLLGCDFSSSPSRRKSIVLAWGAMEGTRVTLARLERLETLDAFSHAMAQPGDWVGGFDLPFGLPRQLVQTLGWPLDWADCMRHYAGLSRAEIRERFAAFCNARPVGAKFAHRATDLLAKSPPAGCGRVLAGFTSTRAWFAQGGTGGLSGLACA